ncbi:uncharacterized protein GIQ15_05540 [Arthroderma uncinatum]|uniref:uncharacterized protein n=1 Tax=Arthroderma uncinatum TaxID=74035 RepID=UPI00144A6E6A|nr:uncharacterized protein GIQ15_05540 [Arthroderma uncinatum]KAF3480193.1 hypothetical protein GIQ15_05540 [Arthroderma uncinatum]
MAFVPTYFLCPVADVVPPPPRGALALGSILRSLATPLAPVNKDEVLTAPNVDSATETDWQKTTSDSTSLSVGVFTTFLELLLGLRADVSIDHSRQDHSSFEVEKLTTVSFQPTVEYVREALRIPSVQQYRNAKGLARCRALYLVTGLKVASGAAIRHGFHRGPGVSAEVGVDGTTPITIGPTCGWSRERAEETSFYRRDEFIFAYRLHKISFFLKSDPTVSPYIKGAFLNSGEIEESEAEDETQFMLEEVEGVNLPGSALLFANAENPLVYVVRPVA